MPRSLALALLAALSLAACNQKSAEPELQLRSYSVPAGSAERLRGVLANALYLEKDKSVVAIEPSAQYCIPVGPTVVPSQAVTMARADIVTVPLPTLLSASIE